MSYDLLILGAGLSGLYAGVLAARRGKKVLLLAQGVGATHIGAGTIDVHNDLAALKACYKSKTHPYALIGAESLQKSLEELKTICAAHNYPLQGELGKNFKLPTAIGATRTACLIPETMSAGDLNRSEPMMLAHIAGFRDFAASLAGANLQIPTIDLPCPHTSHQRDMYATDFAYLFDHQEYRAEVIKLWKPLLKGDVKRVGLPAMLGLQHTQVAKQELESELGIELFEIPTLPPSVAGMRLFNLLRHDLQTHGGQIILGPRVTGEIADGRVSAVTTDMNGHKHTYTAEKIILASGGFLNGGLVGEMNGEIKESIFNLPINNLPHSEWTNEKFLAAHAYAKLGVKVNAELQPLDANNKVIAQNLFAIGSILAGADRVSEGSREGIEVGSAWKVASEK